VIATSQVSFGVCERLLLRADWVDHKPPIGFATKPVANIFRAAGGALFARFALVAKQRLLHGQLTAVPYASL
jgi:hypothetical protein